MSTINLNGHDKGTFPMVIVSVQTNQRWNYSLKQPLPSPPTAGASQEVTRPVLPTNTSRPLLIPVGKLEKDPRIHPPRNPILQTNSHYSPACSRPTQGDRSTGLGPHSLRQPSRGESGDPASQQPPEAPVVVRSRLRARAPLCCTWVQASDSRAPTSCDRPLHTTQS